MVDRFVFSVEYDEAVSRFAAWNDCCRRLAPSWMMLAVCGLIDFVALTAPRYGLLDTAIIFAAEIGAMALLVAWGGRAHWRGMRAERRQTRDPRATFRLDDDDISVEDESGGSRLQWCEIRDVWQFDRVWLPMPAYNKFVTSPLNGAPPEALAFSKLKVAPRRL